MGPWITQPLIVPEFTLDEISDSQAEYPVTLSGYPAVVVECGSGWVLMIRIPEPEQKERWYHCASLLLIANQLYKYSLIERNNALWLACRYFNNQVTANMLNVELQISVSVYLGGQLKRLLQKDEIDTSQRLEDNRLAHYFTGMI